MKRTINTVRTYNLGQYQNIKIFDEILELDSDILDSDLIEKLRYLQFVSIELAYRNYIELQKGISHYSLDEQIEALEEIKLNLFEEIEEHLTKNEKGENEND